MNSQSDERQSAAVLQYYEGHGAVLCFDRFESSLLLEWLMPGTPLTQLVVSEEDEKAMRILCGIIRTLHAHEKTLPDLPTVEQQVVHFARYRKGPLHPALPIKLVEHAEKLYTELCCSQRHRVVLHGDLHHDNVLFSKTRGWVAIDPKGLLGEPEYELGAALRNPSCNQKLYAETAIVKRRIAIAAEELGFDTKRIAAWCFAQAVLSSIWAYEDRESESSILRGVVVAHATLPLL